MAGRYEQLELKDVDEVDNELSTATRSSTAGAWLFSAMRNVHPAHMWHRLKQVLLLWTLVSLLLYSWLVFFSERVSTSYVSPRLLGATNILWLTAHPDDESMFFAPSIFNLLSRHTAPNGTSLTSTGHILSLSSGNNDGLGAQRTIEMRAACLGLGITTENCIVLDVNTLPDDPNVWWPEDVIEYWTRAYIDKWSIDTIVTFDEDGISGHANHRAINAALVKASNFDLEFPPVFTLRTTRSVLAKYSSMLLYPYVRISHRWRVNHPLPAIQWDPDVFPIAKQRHEFLHKPPRFQQKEFRSGYSHPFSQHATLLVNSPWQYLKSRTAFKQHKSQVLWFRRLYMFASRYMWFNELLGVDRIHERVVDLGKVREAARKDSL